MGTGQRWCFKRDGKVVTVSVKQLRQMLAAGEIQPTHHVWREDGTNRTFILAGRLNQLHDVDGKASNPIDGDGFSRRADHKSKSLSLEISLAEDRERRRLAKLLHDHVQQLLVGARFHNSLLDGHNDETVMKVTRKVDQLLEECLVAVRSLTSELSPLTLHDEELPAGLALLVQWMSDNHGLQVKMTIDEDLPEISNDHSVLVFDSIRELLFNTVKHSGVHAAEVQVQCNGKNLNWTVRDHGSGFDVKGVQFSLRGHGLIGTRERIKNLGGDMTIESGPGKGTAICLVIPIHKSDDQLNTD